MKRQRRITQEIIVQPWVLSPPQLKYITSLNSAELNPPTNGRCELLDETFFIPERSQFDNL